MEVWIAIAALQIWALRQEVVLYCLRRDLRKLDRILAQHLSMDPRYERVE